MFRRLCVHDRDNGQAVALVLTVIVLVVLFMVATARFSSRLIESQQAQLAADAAALAGVVGGREAAEHLAVANGAVLVSFVSVDDEVHVEVMIGAELARARATRAP